MRRILLALLFAGAVRAESWHSTVTNSDLPVRVIEPGTSASTPPRAIVYVTNLPIPRAGTEADEAILADFVSAGYLVAVLDYQHHPDARWPKLNRDLFALRAAFRKEKSCFGHKVDPAHIFIVPSGDRLKTDVVFYHDGSRTLALDIVYPSKPAKPVGTVLEFSCDNENRMGNGSLDSCSDTLLEGAAIEGFAAAMADHPVGAPYKGLDPMPDSAWKIKAAVRTLRAEGAKLGLAGDIVPIGFSRGSGMALMLVTTQGHREFEGHGEHPEADSSVQGAVILSGRFTYIDLLPKDKMLGRYTSWWGDRVSHEAVWREHGALDYLHASICPLYLSINVSESPDAQHQMDVLQQRLDALHSPFEYHPESTPRGHKVPLDADVLDPMLAYLKRQLK
jgi:acetyl esterase/lipase